MRITTKQKPSTLKGLNTKLQMTGAFYYIGVFFIWNYPADIRWQLRLNMPLWMVKRRSGWQLTLNLKTSWTKMDAYMKEIGLYGAFSSVFMSKAVYKSVEFFPHSFLLYFSWLCGFFFKILISISWGVFKNGTSVLSFTF